ncbi:hypothetical protein BN8_04234 [Fibrisoma limi BUZ 3]|uniref:Uncharacterized protein n=1 Tax=Fibrisoma limi BUZ 3 TaxID=1185876 RepID=I2GM78_9BACT|nr:hypothetical protein BN8_04234 [Fibrisoma limi BUZ 3]
MSGGALFSEKVYDKKQQLREFYYITTVQKIWKVS